MPRILTIPRTQASPLSETGCWPVAALDFMQPPLWRLRPEVEHDESLLQPIAYLALLNKEGQAWCYQRSGGDARVDGRLSCGVGGHVDDADAVVAGKAKADTPFDADATLRRALLRELSEELHATAADLHELRLQGLIYEGLSAIGRVHLGVLYTAQWRNTEAPQPRPDDALQGLGFMDLNAIAADARFELWSRLAARHLQVLRV